jgi:condensation enzyme
MSNELEDPIPLSFSQDFMCMFDQGDDQGPFGPRYHIAVGWRVRGAIDVDVLHGALDDVVARNEVLRTMLVRGEGPRSQIIHPPSRTELDVRDLTGTAPADRDARAEELLIEIEAGEYPFRQPPLLTAVLGRFDDEDSVLVLIAQHIEVDGWSMQLIIKELAEFYAARRENREADLPEVLQFQEYARWERDSTTAELLEKRLAYWRTALDGADIVGTPSDFARSAGLPKNSGVDRFVVGPDVSAAALELAKATRSSPFMVLIAAYKVLLSELTGKTDITINTIMSGRGQARFEKTVGSFFNFVPLRTDLAGAANFREIVERVRKTCLGAFSNVVPFATMIADTPELAGSFFAEDSQVFAFQVFQFPFLMAAHSVGDLEYSEIRERYKGATISTDVPDGALWTLDIDPAGTEMIGQLQYNSNRFEPTTIRQLVEKFEQVLKQTVTSPD